jgi:gliding motility-associated-like protein
MKSLLGVIFLCLLLSKCPVVFAQTMFIENKGQYTPKNFFYGKLPEGRVFFQADKLVYDFYNMKSHHDEPGMGLHQDGESEMDLIKRHAYYFQFKNSNPDVKVTGNFQGQLVHNYFVGDKSKWATEAHEYSEVYYTELYSGIDFKYYNYGNSVKYDFIVAPEADINQIQIEIDGANTFYVDEQGHLNIETEVNKLMETRPIAYQWINGEKKFYETEFSLNNGSLSINLLEDYDPCLELTIDPTLIFSTYSGSTADNWGNTATFDDASNLYSGGITSHYSGGAFPATSGAYQTTYAGAWDVAILKYDSLGQQPIYATYLGGSQSEVPQSLIVDKNNNLLVMGVTGSSNYPTQNAFQSSYGGGTNAEPFGGGSNNVLFPFGSDIFITKISASGSSLLASTFIGGTANDGLMIAGEALVSNYGDQSRGDIYIKEDGNILVASKTSSTDFPLLNAFQDTFAGGSTDAVVFEMSANLTDLIFSSYLGGPVMDAAYSIKSNNNGKIIVAGGTNSATLAKPTEQFSNSKPGKIDGWVSIIDNITFKLDTGIYVGTSETDQVYFIDLDSEGNIYTYGQTSGAFPIKGNVYTSGGGQFLQKWNNDLTNLELSTRFGSSGSFPNISPTAFLVNDCDNIYLSGWGGGTNNGFIGGSTVGMPITADAFQSTTNGSDFYLMTLSANAEELLYATYLGGSQSQTHVDGGTSRFDKRGIVYHAVCAGCGSFSDFPTTPDAFSSTNNSQNCNNAAFKFDLASLRAVIQTNSVELNNPGVSIVCFPDDVVFQNLSIGGEIFEWDFGDGNSVVANDTLPIVHNYANAGNYKITLKAIDQNTCISEDVTSTTLQVARTIFDVIGDQTLCEGSSLRLTAFGGTNYFWTSADSLSQSTNAIYEVSPLESTTYYVSISDELGCSKIDTVNVEVLPGLELSFDYLKVYDCFSRPELQVVNTSVNEGAYSWDFGDGSISDQPEDTHIYQQDGNYSVTLIGASGQCVYEESKTVAIQTLKVPNVYTPNGDSDNEVFEIIASNKVKLTVWNRWGKTILETDDYQNDWKGVNEPSGVYYYEAVIEDVTTCKGWVHLIK